jgi:hypothetical protein
LLPYWLVQYPCSLPEYKLHKEKQQRGHAFVYCQSRKVHSLILKIGGDSEKFRMYGNHIYMSKWNDFNSVLGDCLFWCVSSRTDGRSCCLLLCLNFSSQKAMNSLHGLHKMSLTVWFSTLTQNILTVLCSVNLQHFPQTLYSTLIRHSNSMFSIDWFVVLHS